MKTLWNLSLPFFTAILITGQNLYAQSEELEVPTATLSCSTNYETTFGKSYSAAQIFEIPLSNAFPEMVGGSWGGNVSFELPGIKGSFQVFPQFESLVKAVPERISSSEIIFPKKRVRTGKISGLGFRHYWEGLVGQNIDCSEDGKIVKSGPTSSHPVGVHSLGIYPLRKGSESDIKFTFDSQNPEISCGMALAQIRSLSMECDVMVDNAEYEVRQGNIYIKSNVVQIYHGDRENGKDEEADLSDKKSGKDGRQE